MGLWYDEEEELHDTIRDQAKRKAQFCLATGVQPSEYDNLTTIEINEFIREANRRSKKGGS